VALLAAVLVFCGLFVGLAAVHLFLVLDRRTGRHGKTAAAWFCLAAFGLAVILATNLAPGPGTVLSDGPLRITQGPAHVHWAGASGPLLAAVLGVLALRPWRR
jgi:hypothetical protein